MCIRFTFSCFFSPIEASLKCFLGCKKLGLEGVYSAQQIKRNNLLNHENSLWKQSLFNIFFHFVFIQSFFNIASVVCVALKPCSRFFSHLNFFFFFWIFQKVMYREELWTVLLIVFCICCNKDFLCLRFFFFVEPGTRSEKSVCQRWLLCKQIYFIQCGLFIWFFNLSQRQRLDKVFYVPQNVPQNFINLSFVKGSWKFILPENKIMSQQNIFLCSTKCISEEI